MQKETPSPTKKSKRKKTTPEQNESNLSQDQTTIQKKRKKNVPTVSKPSPADQQQDVSSVAPLETIKPEFISEEFATGWDPVDKRKI